MQHLPNHSETIGAHVSQHKKVADETQKTTVAIICTTVKHWDMKVAT
jgi:hypothetical protein